LLQLQETGIVHRDVKPQNLLLTERGVILIDFNIASRAGDEVRTISGTPRYQPPDANLARWTVSTDLFASGVVLFELLCGSHPYPDGHPRVDRTPTPPREFRADLSDEMCEFLAKACAPIESERFLSAHEMKSTLLAIDEIVVPAVSAFPSGMRLPKTLLKLSQSTTPNVNPFVTEMLALGSQARITNRATRGLTELAEATYVRTRLDEDLAVSALEGKHRLVMITGNAGDGKTAFIQQLEGVALSRGAVVERQDQNGRHLSYANQNIFTLYDGSQDEGESTSDELLIEFLAPFSIGARPDTSTRIGAINEGRLRDFLVAHSDAFPDLLGMIAQLDDPSADVFDDAIVVVNLNLRSVTAGGEDSIFSRQLQQIVTGPFWDACQRCDFRSRCPIKHNVDTFGDPTSGAAVTERLRRLIDLVRIRRRRHLTMRDVRSLISFLLFRDRTCEEVGDLLERSERPGSVLDLAYFQGIGGRGVAEGSSLDRAISLLAEAEVGPVSNPLADRALAYGRIPRRMSFPERDSDYPLELIRRTQRDAGRGYESDAGMARAAHEALRRLVFFERSDDGWWEMLPYRKLQEFELALEPGGATQRAALLKEAIRALSMAEGITDPELAGQALWLAASDDVGGHLRSYRRLPAEDMALEVLRVPAPYVEYVPDQLELIHRPSGISLNVSVDVLEVLERLRDGHVPSLEEARGLVVNLRLFKHQLLAEPHAELVLLTETGLARIGAGPGGRIELTEEVG
jgi:hypothetical protein